VRPNATVAGGRQLKIAGHHSVVVYRDPSHRTNSTKVLKNFKGDSTITTILLQEKKPLGAAILPFKTYFSRFTDRLLDRCYLNVIAVLGAEKREDRGRD
jgi:hypothetical protein